MIKERLDLSPKLRELDKSTEEVELSLRKLIITLLHDDISLIPYHIKQKADERIQRAAQKNPAFDLEKYQTFSGILEFFDLRDLQEAIISKSLWPEFETLFLNKETLTQKFNQLAELRNGIRHSRSIDEIIKKEGEAAIIWFTMLLEKYVP